MLSRRHLKVPALVLTLAFAACGGGDTESSGMGEQGEEAMAAPASASEAATAAETSGPQESPACWLRPGVTPEAAAERVSPRDSASIQLDAGIAKICYGAPSVRGRTIFGELEEYGQPWRMGADEATALHLTFPAEVAGIPVDPGAYSLMGIPGRDTWEIIVNNNAQRWGIPITDEVRSQDVGTSTVTPEELDSSVEQLRYRFESEGADRATLYLEWANTRIPISIEAQ